MIVLTHESVVKGLNALVDEYGYDHVYQGHGTFIQCTYVHDGQPDCIVGKLLHSMGVSLARLERADFNNGRSVAISASELVRELASEDVITAEWGVDRFLSEVQSHQDSGMKWGDAVMYAVSGC